MVFLKYFFFLLIKMCLSLFSFNFFNKRENFFFHIKKKIKKDCMNKIIQSTKTNKIFFLEIWEKALKNKNFTDFGSIPVMLFVLNYLLQLVRMVMVQHQQLFEIWNFLLGVCDFWMLDHLNVAIASMNDRNIWKVNKILLIFKSLLQIL